MEFEDVRPFMESHHRGVITTYQPDGGMHNSLVSSGAYQGNAAFVIVYPRAVKTRNLRRDPRCTVTTVDNHWRNHAVVEGKAQLFDSSNTDAEELRILRRALYRACGDKDHPDWEEFDRAMVAQEAVVVLVKPERVYGRVDLP